VEKLQIIIDLERASQNGNPDPTKNLKIWDIQLKLASRKVLFSYYQYSQTI